MADCYFGCMHLSIMSCVYTVTHFNLLAMMISIHIQMYILYRDPKGKRVFSSLSSELSEKRLQLNRRVSLNLMSSMNMGSPGSSPEDMSLIISMLTTRVVELEGELRKRNTVRVYLQQILLS